MKSKSKYSEYVSIDEMCQILRIGKTTAYKLIKAKAIPSCRIGKKIIIKEADINDYIERQLSIN